jgi:hypothetical protein
MCQGRTPGDDNETSPAHIVVRLAATVNREQGDTLTRKVAGGFFSKKRFLGNTAAMDMFGCT